MLVYLPIAEMSADALLLVGIGFGVGWLSGLFGVGGGFLLTPLLILIGIPSAVAVASGANQTLGASVSGLIAQWRRGNVDAKMGGVLLVGGLLGSAAGVQLFALLRRIGQVDLAVSLFYVVVLGTVGVLMVMESARAILRRRRAVRRRLHAHYWMHGLPLKARFRKSRLYISVIPPALVGFGIGVLSAVMGVGGGFMLGGGVAGAQFGAALGTRLRGEETRALLGLMVLGVALSLLWGLVRRPDNLFSLGPAL